MTNKQTTVTDLRNEILPTIPDQINYVIIFDDRDNLSIVEISRKEVRDAIFDEYNRVRHKLIQDHVQMYRGLTRIIDNKYYIQAKEVYGCDTVKDKIIKRIKGFTFASTRKFDMEMLEQFCLMVDEFIPIKPVHDSPINLAQYDALGRYMPVSVSHPPGWVAPQPSWSPSDPIWVSEQNRFTPSSEQINLYEKERLGSQHFIQIK